MRQSPQGERTARYQRMLARAEQLASMGSWHWDVGADELIWSEELCRIYGVPPDTPLSYEAYLARVHSDDRAMVQTVVRRALERREPFRFQERIVRPDGEVRVLDSVGEVELDDDGRVVAMFGSCRDVTREKQAQDALRQREERFSKIFHASPVASSLTALADGRFVDVNRRYLELTGYAREDLIGRVASEVGLADRPRDEDAAARELRERGSIREAAIGYRTRDGQQRRALAAIERIEIDGRDCLLTLIWRT